MGFLRGSNVLFSWTTSIRRPGSAVWTERMVSGGQRQARTLFLFCHHHVFHPGQRPAAHDGARGGGE